MAGKTISEKILSIKSGVDARAGDLVICNVDYAMGTDGSVPMALDYFDKMRGETVFDPSRIIFVMDHYNPVAGHKTAELQDRVRVFARKYGIFVCDIGSGISHQLMVENGRTRPGGLLVGADSHSVTGGALNAFATGIGSSDLAATMICGKIWLKVPQTIKVILDGKAHSGVYPKDIALALSGMISADGAAYQTLEFHGSAAAEMEPEDRLVLSNMSVEMGAKAGIFLCDQKTVQYLQGRTSEPLYPTESDSDAVYSREIVIDVSKLEPKIARPHTVDNVTTLRDVRDIPIQMVYLGTCTGGRVNDFHQALAILERAGRIASGVKLVVSPASMEIETELERDGTLAKLRHFGAIVTLSGCGSCCGTAGPIPEDDVNVMSTANRNFKARMGNGKASIYLGSPAACAAAAVTGKITDPDSIQGTANENQS